MGAEWCVKNSLRRCSAHSLHAYLLFRRFYSLVRFPCSLVLGWTIRLYSPVVDPPADDDTARYLSEALGTLNQDQRRRSTTEVKNALEETRTREETMELGFEDRVSAALSILGVS